MLLRQARALLILLLMASGFAHAQETEVVAISGTPAPDGNGTIANFITDPSDPDDPFTNSSGPVLNDDGQIAFVAYLTETAGGPGTPSDDSGIFLRDGGDIIQLVREGQTSPDEDGVFGFFRPLFEPGINNSGDVVFQHPLRNSANGAFFAWGAFAVNTDGSDLSVVLRDGMTSPDDGGILTYLDSPAITDNGRMTFSGHAEVEELGVVREKEIIFRGDLATGEVEVIAREDEDLPDGNGRFNLFDGGGDINEAGQVVFGTSIRGGALNDEAIYLADPDGTITPVVRFGDPAISSDEVVVVIPVRSPINDAGQVVYSTITAPCATCSPSRVELVRYDDGEHTAIAHTGSPAPGGGVFVSFFQPNVGVSAIVPALNEQGQVGFYATVQKEGLLFNGFYRSDGIETVRVVDNDQLTPSGIDRFNLGCNSAPAFDCDDSIKMNESGQFAFFTTLRNNNIEVNEGIFFYDDDLGRLKVARKGDELLGSPIVNLRFTHQGSNAHDSARSGLNNLGQVAYAFELADGRSGLALWSPQGNPVANEPTTLPAEFSVAAAYPNPFRDTASLQFTLPGVDGVRLAVYDVLGRRVVSRDLGLFAEGTHNVDLDAEALPSGVYIARLTAGSRAAASVRLIKAD